MDAAIGGTQLGHCERLNGGRLAQAATVSSAKLWGSIALLVAAFDFLFYRQAIGISVAIFGVLLVAVLLWNASSSRWDGYRVAILALIAGALAQSAVAIGFCNAVVLLVLFSLLMIDDLTQTFGYRAASVALAPVAWLRSLGRWNYLIQITGGAEAAAGKPTRRRVLWLIGRVIVPTLCAVIPLLWLMGSGNLLLGRSIATAVETIERWLRLLEWPSLDRIIMWCVVATGALTFLWPSIDLRVGALCVKRWPEFSLADETASRWRTWSILGAANALFFWGNGLDAWFLWHNAKLPAGVSYSDFVHQGVFALIGTALLSALMLAALFQQHDNVSRHPLTRTLALLWIAQNLFLLSSVGLRLKLYVEAYQLSVLRFHVGSFLVLIAVGYGLLAWRVVARKSLNWLLAANAMAVFALFYGLQFIDVGGIVARYNVDHWRRAEAATLDVPYLGQLGPGAWPSLARIRREYPGTSEAIAAGKLLTAAQRRLASHQERSSWRAWQWREARIENEVFPTLVDPGKPTP